MATDTLESLVQRATQCKAQNQLDDAIAYYRKALDLQPRHSRTHNSLGIAYAQQRNYGAAEACFRKAVEIEPDYAKAFNNLGNVLSEQGKLTDAAGAYQQAYHLGYRDAGLYDNLAHVYMRQGDARAAEVQLQKALRSNPNDLNILKRLGLVLTTLVQFDSAIATYRKVLRLNPNDADAWSRLGDAYSGQGFLDKSLEAFQAAIKLNPEEGSYHHHYGATLMQVGELDAALVSLRRGVELKPTDPTIHSSLLFCLCYDPKANQGDVLAEHRRWGEVHAPPLGKKPEFSSGVDPERVLRIGYVSPDLRGHPVGRFIQPALTDHDPTRFELFCYDEFVRPADPVTHRMQSKVKNWRNIRGMTDAQVAELIRADKIDILVDLAGHTASNRLRAFALKPAPIQVSYLGYPNTTGVAAIDYLFTDAVVDPPEGPCYLSEEPVRLATGFCCFPPRRDVPNVNALPALKNGYITFGSLHGQSKLNGPVVDLWAELLQLVPTSKLLFARHTMVGEAKDRLVRLFASRGIGADRLRFKQLTAGSGEYWNVYPEIDISLDPFPWTGHTTSCESLWMGVPVITLRGQAHAGRMVASVLTYAGLGDWVAETPAEYVVIGKRWADNIKGLAQVRAVMRANLEKSKLCDPASYTRELERTFRELWKRWCDQRSKPVVVPAATPARRDDRGAIDLLARAEQSRLAADWPGAERLFRQLLAADPENVDAWTAFGDACKQLGQWADAATHYRRALDLRPQVPRTWNSLGIVLANRREFAEAEAAFRRVVELDPDHAKGFNNLGNALSELNRLDDAIASYRRSIELGYEDAGLHENLANLLFRLGNYPEAEPHFRQALKGKPNDPGMTRRLAESLAKRNQFDAAADCLRNLLRINPKDAETWWRLGNVMTEQGNLFQAADCYREALKILPNHAPFLHHLGTALMMAGRIREATGQYRQAMASMANNRLSHASLLFVMCYDPDLEPTEVLAEHRRWGELYAAPPRNVGPFPNPRNWSRPLRIGYVSPDLRAHPVGRFIEPVIVNHDSQRFEIFCYDEFLRAPDALTGRLQAKVKNWRNTRNRSDDDVAAMVRADGIDILVDLAGHTGSNRLGLFARKPAPVQATWLGYPNTTGVQSIDYLITDNVVDPADKPVLMVEEPVRLAGGFCTFAPRESAPAVTPSPVARNGYLTFGALHNQGKMNHRVLDLWAALLKAVPSSKLLIARHTLTDEARDDLASLFSARGIGPERLELRRLTAGGADHWRVYHDVDISLDPFPWTGHTTACESLWMAVPVITLRGRAHAGRMVASVLTYAGMPEWIAETPEQYVELGRKWDQRREELATLRAGMRDHLRATKLCDFVGFTRHLEEAYRSMWRHWCGQ